MVVSNAGFIICVHMGIITSVPDHFGPVFDCIIAVDPQLLNLLLSGRQMKSMSLSLIYCCLLKVSLCVSPSNSFDFF